MKKFESWLILVLRAIVGLVFIFAAIGKIAVPKSFLVEIHNYDMLPDLVEPILALWLPWMELLIGIFILVGHKLKSSSIMATALLVVFTIGVAIAWGRGLEIDCGCFGGSGQKVGLAKIMQNTGLILSSLYLVVRGEKGLNR
ncbi:MAG: DoxX family membrane protein [Candidatus Kapaibacteriales bacterium]